MREAIDSIIQNYGATVTMVAGEATAEFRAFLQPIGSKSWQNMEHMFGPLGEVPRGQYLYLGPADVDIGSAAFLRCHGVDYLVRKAETLYVGDAALYCWGLCVRKGADDPWSS